MSGRVVVTGGAGYVGHRLVPRLLDLGYPVTVYDTLWFGCQLAAHPLLRVVEGDIRDAAALAAEFKGAWAVIHMACVSNDPSVELDQDISRAINFDCFEPLVRAARKAGVERFVFASTSSVYGISDAPDVREDHPLVPITLYNSTKAECENILRTWGGDLCWTILRPSTICGYSERQRLDLAVNILTNLAVNAGKITVHGGQQKRPNLHIEDMVDAYVAVLRAPVAKVDRETFNVGAGNYTIDELAAKVREIVEDRYSNNVLVEHVGSVDPRSYQVNSDKIRGVLGFVPRRSVADAILDLCGAFERRLLPDPLTYDRYYNVRRMRRVWQELYQNAPTPSVDPTKGHLSEIDALHRATPSAS